MLNNSIENPNFNKKSINQPVPLSKAHIRPPVCQYKTDDRYKGSQIEYYEGASLIRTTKVMNSGQQVGGGRRGSINGFSRQSRARMLELIASILRSAALPLFLTLTYPSKFPTVARSKRDLKIFIQRFIRRFPNAGGIWKLEPQERGAPHFHFLVWGVNLVEALGWVCKNWYEIAGDGDKNHLLFHMGVLKGSQPCVSQVRSWRGVWSYAAKYLGKTFEVAEWGNTWTGRFWGTFNRENIPFGEKKTLHVPYTKAVELLRYQRRFMAMRKRKNLNSLKTFCDADQWISRMIIPIRE